jgi:hypothetical protein
LAIPDDIPDSIFVRMDLAHFRNVSSTFSPVRALVSKNIRSATTKEFNVYAALLIFPQNYETTHTIIICVIME